MKKKQGFQTEQDNSYKILPLYKRKCEMMGLYMDPEIKQLLEKVSDTSPLNSTKFDTLHINNQIGPVQTRAIFESINDIKYDRLKNIKLWRNKIIDQGVRSICKYLNYQGNKVEVLDIMENQITALGCQFLGISLSHNFTKLKHLKLDNNIIGTQGLANLSIGLRSNNCIKKLSIKYCGIDTKGAKYIQQILANIYTSIRSLKLQGNQFGNEGMYDILRAVDLNSTLQKLNIVDTGLNLLDFRAKIMKIVEDEQEYNSDAQENPQNRQGEHKKDQQGEKKQDEANINNVKQVIQIKQEQIKPKTASDRSEKIGTLGQVSVTKKKRKFPSNQQQIQQAQKQEQKIIRTLNYQDKSLQANILGLLLEIMKSKKILSKYDLKYNPISNDAAFMIFDAILENDTIKDVELNNNVDYELRQNLDTLMRKRTGRMPKGRRGGGGKKKKKKGKK